MPLTKAPNFSTLHHTNQRPETSLKDGKSNIIRERIAAIKKTKKITEAMRLVAAAKVRRAQENVQKFKPFNEALHRILLKLIGQVQTDNIQLPLLYNREVKRVIVVGISGDRGLCGSHNSRVISKTEARVRSLLADGIEVDVIPIGKKITQYFRRRSDKYSIKRSFVCGKEPSASDVADIVDELLLDYIFGECDKVEVIYTRFQSLIFSEPAVRTLIPISKTGLEDEEDELFHLTSKEGKFAVVMDPKPESTTASETLGKEILLEDSPIDILNILLPLYLNGQVLRILQESITSELASRMQAMTMATENASELTSKLTLKYNRARQASITQEILEITAGSSSVFE